MEGQKMKTRSMIVVLVILLVGSSFAHAQEQPQADYSWLNGRWEGTLFDGGRGIINLKVVNGNQVEGYERMALRGSISDANNTPLAGTVDGNKVELRRGGPTGMRYILTFVDGTLTGYVRSNRGKVETTFKKMHGTD
jgi:hypothetical protein